ncbi:MAG: cytochrome c [Pseudomonadota bacterium]
MRFLLVFLCCAGVALAHSNATGVVKERMDGMVALGQALKALSADKLEPDLVRKLARDIQAQSGDTMLAGFPEGSLQHPSEAAPAIWTEPARFAGYAQELKDLAGALEAEPERLSEFLPLIGQSCKACHQTFRIKN